MKLSTNELETALNLCRQIKDCGGITKNGNKYEIRAGPATEGTEEESWIRQTDPSGLENVTKNGSKYIRAQTCSSKYITEDDLKSDPNVKRFRFCNEDGTMKFTGKYSHLNSLIKLGFIFFIFL